MAAVFIYGKYAILDASHDIRDDEVKNAIDDAGYEVTGIEAL